MSVTVKFASKDLTATPYFFDVLDVQKPLLAEPQFEEVSYGLFDGSYMGGGAFERLPIKVTLATMASSAAALEARLDALRIALNTRVDQKLECSLWSDRYWMARPAAFPSLDRIGLNGCEIELEFLAEPLAYGDEISKDYPTGTNLITITQEQVANATAEMEPLITFSFGSEGSAVISLKQNQTGAELYYNFGSGLPINAKLEFDSAKHWVRYSVGENWYVRMLGKTGTFPTILPNILNTITVSPVGIPVTIPVTISFLERFK